MFDGDSFISCVCIFQPSVETPQEVRVQAPKAEQGEGRLPGIHSVRDGNPVSHRAQARGNLLSIITFSNPTTSVITRTEEKYHVHHGYRVAEAKCPAQFASFLFRVGAARCCLKIFFPIRCARLQFHYALSYYRTMSAKFFFEISCYILFVFSTF